MFDKSVIDKAAGLRPELFQRAITRHLAISATMEGQSTQLDIKIHCAASSLEAHLKA
jgi:hypothetical protein